MMLPGLVLVGVAFALAYGPLTIAAGGLLNASVQFGGALMLAVVTAVNVVVTGDDPSRADMLAGFRAALFVPRVAVLVGSVVTASGLRGAPGRSTVPSASGASAGSRPSPATADAA